jgi:hypothetical protein
MRIAIQESIPSGRHLQIEAFDCCLRVWLRGRTWPWVYVHHDYGVYFFGTVGIGCMFFPRRTA